MAYQQLTSVANVQSLIDAIATFLSGAGWTIDRNNLVGTNRTVTLRAPGGSDYMHIYNTEGTRILNRISIGYTSGNPPSSQPNPSPNESFTTVGAGVYPNVYLFADGTEFNMVCEIATGNEYRHMVFGVMQKTGAFNGGTYMDNSHRGTQYLGTFPGSAAHKSIFSQTNTGSPWTIGAGYCRIDVTADGRTDFYHALGGPSNMSAALGVCGFQYVTSDCGGLDAYVSAYYGDLNQFDGRSMLHTPVFYIRRTGSPVYYSPGGYVLNTRYANMRRFVDGQEIVIGTETWKLFSLFKRNEIFNPNFNAPNLGSWVYGYAIKKVV